MRIGGEKTSNCLTGARPWRLSASAATLDTAESAKASSEVASVVNFMMLTVLKKACRRRPLAAYKMGGGREGHGGRETEPTSLHLRSLYNTLPSFPYLPSVHVHGMARCSGHSGSPNAKTGSRPDLVHEGSISNRSLMELSIRPDASGDSMH